MKIMLFRDGQMGVVVKIPGERPLEEIGELLGGAVDEPLTRLSGRLALCMRADGEEEHLPIRYAWHKLGREPEPVAGNCAVVVQGLDWKLRDITIQDVEAAQVCVRPAGGLR